MDDKGATLNSQERGLTMRYAPITINIANLHLNHPAKPQVKNTLQRVIENYKKQKNSRQQIKIKSEEKSERNTRFQGQQIGGKYSESKNEDKGQIRNNFIVSSSTNKQNCDQNDNIRHQLLNVRVPQTKMSTTAVSISSRLRTSKPQIRLHSQQSGQKPYNRKAQFNYLLNLDQNTKQLLTKNNQYEDSISQKRQFFQTFTNFKSDLQNKSDLIVSQQHEIEAEPSYIDITSTISQNEGLTPDKKQSDNLMRKSIGQFSQENRLREFYNNLKHEIKIEDEQDEYVTTQNTSQIQRFLLPNRQKSKQSREMGFFERSQYVQIHEDLKLSSDSLDADSKYENQNQALSVPKHLHQRFQFQTPHDFSSLSNYNKHQNQYVDSNYNNLRAVMPGV
eukprot:403331125